MILRHPPHADSGVLSLRVVSPARRTCLPAVLNPPLACRLVSGCSVLNDVSTVPPGTVCE